MIFSCTVGSKNCIWGHWCFRTLSLCYVLQWNTWWKGKNYVKMCKGSVLSLFLFFCVISYSTSPLLNIVISNINILKIMDMSKYIGSPNHCLLMYFPSIFWSSGFFNDFSWSYLIGDNNFSLLQYIFVNSFGVYIVLTFHLWPLHCTCRSKWQTCRSVKETKNFCLGTRSVPRSPPLSWRPTFLWWGGSTRVRCGGPPSIVRSSTSSPKSRTLRNPINLMVRLKFIYIQ